MRRNKKDIKIKVGVFIFTGLVCLVISILFLGKNQTLFSFTNQYKIRFPHVEGLFEGSVVSINGIASGNVVAIDFEKTGEIRVTVAILRQFAHLVTNQSVATLLTRGLLGDKYVALMTKDLQGSPIPTDGYIPAQANQDIMSLFSNQAEVRKISSLLDEILLLLHTFNQEETLKHITTFFSTNKSEDLSVVLKHLGSILKKLDDGEGTAGALINNKNVYNIILSFLGKRPYQKYIPNLINDIKKK